MPYTSGFPSIYYETEGRDDHVPIVLIEGLSAQLIGWREGFRKLLVDRGLRLVLLDNRDAGLSDHCGGPTDGETVYSVADMADDVVRVLDECALSSVHVVGQSMGGAIAQSLAIRQPDRVRSLTLFYTAPSFDGEYIGTAGADRPLPSGSPQSRAEAIEARVDGERYCASPLYGFDETWAREAAGRAYDRSPRTDGVARQRAALVATADHRDRIGTITAPVSVIHGRADDIVRWQGGAALAEAIHGADLHLFAGMGHVIAEQLWPAYAAIITEVVARGEAAWTR